MGGITWAKFAQVPDSFCWILIIVLATRILIGLRRSISPFGKYLILPLFFLLGGVHTTPFLQPPVNPQHIYNQLEERQEAVVTGTLLSAPEIGLEKSRLLLDAEHLQLKNHALPVSGRIRLSMPGTPPPGIIPGDKVMARAKLSRPRSYGVPGAFDYQTFLTYQSIWANGWIYSPFLISEVHEIKKIPFYKKLPFFAEQIRQKIGNFLQTSLPPTTSSIYKAILIGDRSGISPEIIENYKTTGSIHLLAISGMHMGLIALTLGFIITWLLKRSERILLKWPVVKSAAIISLLPLAFYAFIAGLNTPVFRALIMLYIFIGALLFNRQWSILNNIAIAALILLALNPTELFTVSFQLSFTAVCAIAIIYPRLSDFLNLDAISTNNKSQPVKQSLSQKTFKFALAGLTLSTAATLGTAPLLAFHFNRISLLSPITTLLIEPFLCLWSLIIGLVGCILLPFPAIANPIFQIGSWGITVSNYITAALAKLPMASIWLATPTFSAIILYYITLITVFSYLQKSQWPFSKKQPAQLKQVRPAKKGITLLIFSIITISLVLHFQKETNTPEQATISVLDVGQGLATVLEFPSGKTFIIDGGKSHAGRTSNFNVGQDLIAPFLWKKRISNLDGIIISHPHADHYNGIKFLTKHFKPKVIWVNLAKTQNPSLAEYNNLLTQAESLGIPIKIPTKDQVIFKEDNFSIQSIANLHRGHIDKLEGSAARKRDAMGNNKSLVIKLVAGNRTILFPGDIEREAENVIIADQTEIMADVLIAPHHGSITSSTNEFIKKVGGKQVIISAGANKWGKFPSMEVLENYYKAGYKILTTGKSGTISIETDGEDLQIKTFY